MSETSLSPGAALRRLVAEHRPLPIVGAINAYCALLARRAGFRAIYLSGAGVSNASRGLPDLGFITLDDVLTDARRITQAVPDTPLLVDADTGWGDLSNLSRGIKALGEAGVAGVHLEDQVDLKRCGHRPGKRLCAPQDMIDRVKAAVDARVDPGFVVMARTDAAAVEGLAMAIERANRYVEAGADMIFAEALTSVEEYVLFTRAVDVPVLANVTEFGKTPLLTLDELRDAGVALALYPLSAFRAMSAAAVRVYDAIARDGTQQGVVDTMQTRAELYDVLDYHAHEQKLDEQLEGGTSHG